MNDHPDSGRSAESVQSADPRSGIGSEISEWADANQNPDVLRENLAGLLQTVQDMLFVFDEHGTILHVNPAVDDRLEYAAHELVGEPVLKVYPADQHERIQALIHGTSTACESVWPVPLMSRDGRRIEVETRVSCVRWNGKPAFIGVVRSDPPRNRVEAELTDALGDTRRVRDHLAVLLRAAVDVQACFSERQVLEIVAHAVQASGWETVAAYLFRNWEIDESVFAGLNVDEIAYLHAHSRPPDRRAAMFDQDRDPFKLGRSYFVPAESELGQRERQGMRASRRSPRDGDTWQQFDIAYVPLICPSGQILGVIGIDDPVSGQRPDEGTFRYLEFFADLAAGAIHRLRSERERARIHAALLTSESKYRTYVERSPNGILMIDGEGGILEANPRFCAMAGRTQHEIRAQHVSDLIVLQPAIDPLAVLRDDACFDGEALLRTQGAGLRWTAWNIATVADDRYIAFVTDIHQKREALRILERRSDILHAVGLAARLFLQGAEWEQHIPEVLSLLGKASDSSRVYIFENTRALDGTLLTSQRHEWTAENTRSEMDNPDLQNFPYYKGGMGRWADRLGAGDLVHGLVRELPPSERAILDPQGILSILAVPITVHDQWWGFIGFDENKRERVWPADLVNALKTAASIIGAVIERQADERKIRETESSFRTLAANHPDHVSFYQVDGHILFSKAPEGWATRIAPDHRAGRNLQDALPDHLVDPFMERIALASDTRKVQTYQFSVVFDGKVYHYDARFVPLGDDRVMSLIRDATERTQQEQEQLKVQKLESVGVLAAGIAHDFNNILGGILGNLTLAMEFVDPDSEIYITMEDAEKAALRAATLTNKLLTFSKGGAPVKAHAAIAELIRESADFAISGSRTKCRYDFESERFAASVDRAQFSQVVQNLTINACEAMPEGGTLEISVAQIELPKDDVLGLQAGVYLRIVFEDHGRGIPETIIGKVFDPFFSTKPTGSGLGLATAYSVIHKHKGHIAVDSTPGEGTRFTIYLPAAEAIPAGSRSEHTICAEPDETEQSGRILIMDDDGAIRNLAERALTRRGYEVDCAVNTPTTVRMFSEAFEAGRPYDLVILDLTIPGEGGGMHTIRMLKEIDPGVKALVCSGYAEDPAVSSFADYGFCGAITKPFRLRELTDTIRAALTG